MNAGSAVYYSWLNFSLLCNVRKGDIGAGPEMAGSKLEVDVPKKILQYMRGGPDHSQNAG